MGLSPSNSFTSSYVCSVSLIVSSLLLFLLISSRCFRITSENNGEGVLGVSTLLYLTSIEFDCVRYGLEGSAVLTLLILFITSIGLSDLDIFTFIFLDIFLKLLVITEGAPPSSIDCSNSVTSLGFSHKSNAHSFSISFRKSSSFLPLLLSNSFFQSCLFSFNSIHL